MSTSARLARHVAGRLVFVAVLVAVATIGAVLLARLAPGSAEGELFGTAASTIERAEARGEDLRDMSALDVSAQWAKRLVRLDFGTSQKFRRPVLGLVAERAARTGALVAVAFTIGLALGVGIATASAGRRGAWPRVVRAIAIAVQSCPPLLLAIVLSWIAWRSGWQGMAMRTTGVGGWILTLAVPAFALALPLAATLSRAHARVFAETLHAPVMLAVRARGVPERVVRWRHALRLSAPPLVGIASALAGAMLGGSLAVELITSWPGLGRLAYDAFTARDTPLMAGCAAAAALFVGLANALGDAAIVIVDPRTDATDDVVGGGTP